MHGELPIVQEERFRVISILQPRDRLSRHAILNVFARLSLLKFGFS